jgi:hypothetical protein
LVKASRKKRRTTRSENIPMAKAQKPTINDVARLSGVSKKTVSRVINKSPLLNQATREKVEAVIAQLDYVPNPQARALALRRNFLIGLIHDNPNAQMVLGVQEGILDTICSTEFALVVRPVDRHSPTLLDDIHHFIEQQRLYGVMLLPPLSENDELARLCRDLGCTVVRMGSARLDDEAHLVASNDQEAVSEAVAWLAELGHPDRLHRRAGRLPLGPRARAGLHRRDGPGRADDRSGPAGAGTTDLNRGSRAGPARRRQSAHRDLFQQRRNGCRGAACGLRTRAARAAGSLDHRLRRYRHRRAYLAAADNRALADPGHGPHGRTQADAPRKRARGRRFPLRPGAARFAVPVQD